MTVSRTTSRRSREGPRRGRVTSSPDTRSHSRRNHHVAGDIAGAATMTNLNQVGGDDALFLGGLHVDNDSRAAGTQSTSSRSRRLRSSLTPQPFHIDGEAAKDTLF